MRRRDACAPSIPSSTGYLCDVGKEIMPELCLQLWRRSFRIHSSDRCPRARQSQAGHGGGIFHLPQAQHAAFTLERIAIEKIDGTFCDELRSPTAMLPRRRMSVQLRGRFRCRHGSGRTWAMWKQEALALISSKLW